MSEKSAGEARLSAIAARLQEATGESIEGEAWDRFITNAPEDVAYLLELVREKGNI